MTDTLTFRSDSSVKLVNSMASDTMVVQAARISTNAHRGAYTQADPPIPIPGPDETRGLIGYLMKNRHGTPFEHNAFTFRIECPIFVAREFMRHRIASFNEESARYKQLDAVFWLPAPARPLVQEGKPGHYIMKPGTVEQYENTISSLSRAARACYAEYEFMLSVGITREVARAALSVGIYTSFYVTMNARGLMNFLSLRIDDPDSAYPSKPQYEIETAALQMQDIFAAKMPVTCDAFMAAGRVAPVSVPEIGYYLAFPNGTVDFNHGDDTDDMSKAREVMEILLEGEPWVQLHAHHAPGNYTQWTVMKRDERGVPLQIVCQEFDGNIELINNDPDNGG